MAAAALLFLAAAAGAAESGPPPAGPNLGLLEAARISLTHNPDVALAKWQVQLRQGKLQEQAGAFDLNIHSTFSHAHGYDPLNIYDKEIEYQTYRSHETINQTQLSVGLSEKLRQGITLGPRIKVTRHRGTFDLPIERGDNTPLPTSSASVDFVVLVPLAKGLGREAVTAQERSASHGLEASRWSELHTMARKLLETVAAYWELKAARAQLEIFQDAERRARRVLDAVEKLVAGGQMPASEVAKAKADLALKQAQLVGGHDALWKARRQMTLALGIAGGQPLALGRLTDDFPPLDPRGVSLGGLGQDWLELALKHRADLRAARESLKAVRALMAKAENDRLPQVDLKLSLGYRGLSNEEAYDSYYQSLADQVQGLNVQAQVDFALPVQNNLARGRLLAVTARRQQSALRLSKTKLDITAAVHQAVSDLGSAARERLSYRLAVRGYKKAVSNEWMNLKLGNSTILNVIQVEDKLTQAMIAQLQARKKWAQAVARLRYATGTLITGRPDAASLRLPNLTSLPLAEKGGT